MAIRFLVGAATYDPDTDTVRFPAIDENNRLIVCAISRAAMAKALSLADSTPEELLGAYRRHAKSFHLLALYKYRVQRIEPDGTVLIADEDVPVIGAP